MSEMNPHIYMSGAAVPNLPQPQPAGPPAQAPQVVTPHEAPPRKSSGAIWIVLALAVAGGLGYWLWQRQQAEAQQASAVVVRTAQAQAGSLARTIRVTGTTTAEKYVTLIAPSMRGGRGSGGSSGGSMGMGMSTRGGFSGGSSGGSSSGGSSRGSSGGSSSSSSSGGGQSTLAATSMSGGNMVSSTSGASSGSGGGGSAFSGDSLSSTAGGGGSTLRTGGTGRTQQRATPRATTSRSTRASTSASTGADGMGSTANSIPGGSSGGSSRGSGGPGGSSGGGDFMLQLQGLAPNGTRIKKGDTIAEFDRQYMLLRLDDYRATVEQSESAMKASLANLQVTRKSYDQQILAAKNQVAKAELDIKTIPVRSSIDSERLRLALEEAKANYKQLLEAAKYVEIGERATIKTSELELQTSKLELRRAETNADRMILKAPMDGLVVMQSTWRGGEMGVIQQGDQVYPGQMLMQIVDPNSMVINATMSQVDVQSMKLGQKAKVRFDAFPGLEVKAHVMMIGAITKTGGFRASFKKDIPVRLKLDEMDPRIIPDLSASADIVLDEEQAAAVLPAEALQSAGEGAAAKPFVLVRNAAGAWERRTVEVGLTSYTHVAIRSGVKPGEVVALEPPVSNQGKDAPPPKES